MARTCCGPATLALLAGLLPGPALAAAGGPPDDMHASWPAWALQLEAELAPLARLGGVDEARWARLPVRHSRALGIPAGGRRDATPAIQAALDGLVGGGTLVLDPGTYRQTRCLHLQHDTVRLTGQGARLHASNPHSICIALEGRHTMLSGLTLTAAPMPRAFGTDEARVLVHGDGAVVAHTTIRGATSAGIWVQGARRYAVVDNRISGTMADGIHHSEGAGDGLVARNTLSDTGDDGISVVSYRSSAPCDHVLVEDNTVRRVRTARGLSVVGSSAVLVRRNRVEGTGRAAGILVAREPSYDTPGVDRVVIAGNVVTDVGTLRAGEPTGHASVDLNATEAPTPDLAVRRVLVAGNTIEHGTTDGVRLLGGVCGVSLLGNHIRSVAGEAVRVETPTCGPALDLCRGNRAELGHGAPPECGTLGSGAAP